MPHRHHDRPDAPSRSAAKRGGCGDCGADFTALLAVIAIILIAVLVYTNRRGLLPGLWRGKHARGAGFDAESAFAAAEAAPAAPIGEGLQDAFAASEASEAGPGGAPERRSVQASLERLYSTADVDPLVTGLLYEHSDNIRNVYAQRTSHGDVHGLTEYSSSGGPGDLGVDLGPFGLAEYGGGDVGYDDGIPEAWRLPSTPVRWYGPKQRDYYGPEGPTPYTEGLYSLTEPDHDVLVN